MPVPPSNMRPPSRCIKRRRSGPAVPKINQHMQWFADNQQVFEFKLVIFHILSPSNQHEMCTSKQKQICALKNEMVHEKSVSDLVICHFVELCAVLGTVKKLVGNPLTELNFQHAVYKIKVRLNESLKMHIILVHNLVQLPLNHASYIRYCLALSSVLNVLLLVIEFQTSKVVQQSTSFYIIQCSCHKKSRSTSQ